VAAMALRPAAATTGVRSLTVRSHVRLGCMRLPAAGVRLRRLTGEAVVDLIVRSGRGPRDLSVRTRRLTVVRDGAASGLVMNRGRTAERLIVDSR
jgi:hypothetical protein